MRKRKVTTFSGIIPEEIVRKVYDIRPNALTGKGWMVHTVTERCRDCRYNPRESSAQSSFVMCDYLCITGRPRMCPAGDACDKYAPCGGAKPKHPNRGLTLSRRLKKNRE